MNAKLLDGNALSKQIKAELQAEITAYSAAQGAPPTLAVVRVGDDEAAAGYGRAIERNCKSVGVAFQLPLAMLILHWLGIFTVRAYLEKWRVAVLVVFFLAMVLTPAEPVSMMLMAIPLTLLYFLGIAMCRWMPRRRNPFGEPAEA